MDGKESFISKVVLLYKVSIHWGVKTLWVTPLPNDIFLWSLFSNFVWVLGRSISILHGGDFKRAWRPGLCPGFSEKSKVSVAHFGLVTGAHLPFFRPNEGGGASREKCGKHLLGSEKQFAPQNFYRNPNLGKACVKKNIIISGVNSVLSTSRGVKIEGGGKFVVQGRKNRSLIGGTE